MRDAVGKIKVAWAKTSAHVWRAIYLIGVLSFLLPFVTVKGCASSEVSTYRGYELIGKDFQEFRDFGWYFLLPICIGLAFWGLSFVPRRGGELLQGFMKSWRLLFSSTSFCVVFLFTFLKFLFDTVNPLAGWYLGVTCWSLVWIAAFAAVITHIYRMTSASSPSPSAVPRRSLLLRVEHYLLALFAVAYPISSFIKVYGTAGWGELPWTLISLWLFSMPAVFVLYFAAHGLKNDERWAVVWSASISFLLLILGIVSSACAVTSNNVPWLLVILPASCLVAIALASALSALRQCSVEFWKNRKPNRNIEGMS